MFFFLKVFFFPFFFPERFFCFYLMCLLYNCFVLGGVSLGFLYGVASSLQE